MLPDGDEPGAGLVAPDPALVLLQPTRKYAAGQLTVQLPPFPDMHDAVVTAVIPPVEGAVVCVVPSANEILVTPVLGRKLLHMPPLLRNCNVPALLRIP